MVWAAAAMAGINFASSLLDSNDNARAAEEQARLARMAAESQAQFAKLQNAADQWKLTLTMARASRMAVEKEAMGVAAGAMAAGAARAQASVSNLSSEEGTTTANMIVQARDKAIGEGTAAAKQIRDQARFNRTLTKMQMALDFRARADNVQSAYLQADQASRAAADARDPFKMALGAAGAAAGGFSLGDTLQNTKSFGKLTSSISDMFG